MCILPTDVSRHPVLSKHNTSSGSMPSKSAVFVQVLFFPKNYLQLVPASPQVLIWNCADTRFWGYWDEAHIRETLAQFLERKRELGIKSETLDWAGRMWLKRDIAGNIRDCSLVVVVIVHCDCNFCCTTTLYGISAIATGEAGSIPPY